MMGRRRANVIGMGLIGGWIGMALRDEAWTVTGYDRDAARSARALELGAIDGVGTDPNAHVTFVATPVKAVADEARQALAATSGLVTDVGGVLAHGSIVAREFGLPAVLGTGEASQRIRHGQRITVDGDRGLVYLEPSGAAEGSRGGAFSRPAIQAQNQTGDREKTRSMAKKQWEDLTTLQKGGIALSSAVQIGLLLAVLVNIYRRRQEEIRGSKWAWTVAAFVTFVGPIAYFLFARRR